MRFDTRAVCSRAHLLLTPYSNSHNIQHLFFVAGGTTHRCEQKSNEQAIRCVSAYVFMPEKLTWHGKMDKRPLKGMLKGDAASSKGR